MTTDKPTIDETYRHLSSDNFQKTFEKTQAIFSETEDTFVNIILGGSKNFLGIQGTLPQQFIEVIRNKTSELALTFSPLEEEKQLLDGIDELLQNQKFLLHIHTILWMNKPKPLPINSELIENVRIMGEEIYETILHLLVQDSDVSTLETRLKQAFEEQIKTLDPIGRKLLDEYDSEIELDLPRLAKKLISPVKKLTLASISPADTHHIELMLFEPFQLFCLSPNHKKTLQFLQNVYFATEFWGKLANTENQIIEDMGDIGSVLVDLHQNLFVSSAKIEQVLLNME